MGFGFGMIDNVVICFWYGGCNLVISGWLVVNEDYEMKDKGDGVGRL